MATGLLMFVLAAGASPERPAKVVLLGVDGVSLNLLEPLIKKGVTPNLGRLAASGARGHLASFWPLRTPQVWTTVVTGKLPGQHGIWDHFSNTYFNPPPFRTPDKQRVTSAQRRSRALWNLLPARGHRMLVVGWMATWPAEPIAKGVMVAPVELLGDRRQTTIKGSFYRDAKGMVQPKELEGQVRGWITEASDIDDNALRPFADVPPEDSPLYTLPYLRRYVYGLRWSLARARSVEKITLKLLETQKGADVVLAYFQCPDSLLHRFWVFHKSPAKIAERLRTHGLPEVHAAELHRRFGRVVEACYRDVDTRIGRLLKQTQGPETLVLVVSDHGFGHAPVPHRMKGEPYSGDHLDEGVLLAAGPGIAPNTRVTGSSVVDITPTLLAYLGLPVAEDMRGEPIRAVVGTRKVRTRPTYETRPQRDVPFAEGWPPRQVPPRSVLRDPGL